MSAGTLQLTPALRDYLLSVSVREDDVLRRLREETLQLPQGGMQISPEQGQLMTMLARLIGVRRAIEVGTFTGYSSICLARALPADGELVCCDRSDEWTGIARRYWAEAGVEDRITLRLGPALATLDALLEDGHAGRFDLVFVDADKENYGAYHERALQLLRPGGLELFDNVLWSGAVIDPDDHRESTVALRELNERLAGDDRVDVSMIPIGDGLTLARKR